MRSLPARIPLLAAALSLAALPSAVAAKGPYPEFDKSVVAVRAELHAGELDGAGMSLDAGLDAQPTLEGNGLSRHFYELLAESYSGVSDFYHGLEMAFGAFAKTFTLDPSVKSAQGVEAASEWDGDRTFLYALPTMAYTYEFGGMSDLAP